jgi:peptidoglycan/LPS O-acetylase OafA/YrhL
MKEIKPLTSLRALAALLVFMYHYAWLFPPGTRGVDFTGEWVPLMTVWRQGQVGVSIFFVLSGFLITRIYFDQMAAGQASLRLFFVKRVARIWPLFLAFAVIQHLAEVRDGNALTKSALVTLSMTQGFFEHLRYSGLPTAWSLTIEESFYVFAPLLFLILIRLTDEKGRAAEPLTARRLVRLVAAVAASAGLLLALGLGITSLSVQLGADWQGFMGSRYNLLHATLFGRFPEFGIGVLAAFVHRGLDIPTVLRGRRADLACAVLFAAIGGCMAGKSLLEGGVSLPARAGTIGLSYALAILAGVMILTLSAGHGLVHRLLSHRVPVFLGKVSYGFYLVQLTVMMTPLLAVSDRLGWARLPALLVLTNAFCALVYLGLEVPARRFIVQRWGGMSTRLG